MSDETNPFASPQASVTERPEVVWATEHPEALRKVKLGLTLVYVGICGMLLCFLVWGPVLIFKLRGSTELHWVVLLGLAFIAFLIVTLVGQAFCVAVPAESQAKLLAVSAIVLELAFLLAGIMRGVIPMGLSTEGIVLLVQMLLGAAAVVCFLLFLRKVARYIDRRDVVGRATRSLAVAVLTSSAMIIGFAGMRVAPQHIEIFDNVLGLAMLCTIVALVMYANTVTYLRKAITV